MSMPMPSILSNLPGGSLLFRRQRDRLQSEHEQLAIVDNDDDDDDDEQPVADHGEEGSFINNNSSNSAEEPPDVEAGRATNTAVDNDQEEEEEETTEGSEESSDHGVTRFAVRPTLTLAELEEERELARRRSSACVLFALFVLFRLWVLALQDGDFGVLLLCLVGSSWTARWIRYNRDQEQELDRRIANYLENNENGSTENVGREDLRMLSFQAQLALAIMESQRQMMQGGYGHPDGEGQNPGVSENAKSKWTNISYKASRDGKQQGKYGSVADQDNDLKKAGMMQEEEPHCSICLGEYEDDEELSQLPCKHLYHTECIDSWCSSHIRCPLCNFDLETGAEESV